MVALSVASKPLPLSVHARPSRLGARVLGDHVDGRARAARRRRPRGLRGRDGALRHPALVRLEGTGRILVEQAAGRTRGRTSGRGSTTDEPTDLGRLSGALIAPRAPRCQTHWRAIGPITGSSNSSPALALIIRKIVEPRAAPRPDDHPHEVEQQRRRIPRPATPSADLDDRRRRMPSTKIAPCSEQALEGVEAHEAALLLHDRGHHREHEADAARHVAEQARHVRREAEVGLPAARCRTRHLSPLAGRSRSGLATPGAATLASRPRGCQATRAVPS